MSVLSPTRPTNSGFMEPSPQIPLSRLEDPHSKFWFRYKPTTMKSS